MGLHLALFLRSLPLSASLPDVDLAIICAFSRMKDALKVRGAVLVVLHMLAGSAAEVVGPSCREGSDHALSDS